MNLDRLKKVVEKAHKELKNHNEGSLATYIPELANANPDAFAISVTTVDGEVFSVGDSNDSFSLQSTSKPFVYSLALSQHGIDHVHSHVGVEPTGEAFNSIIELEEKSHRPFNPMINSGAIATTSLLQGSSFDEKLIQMLKFFEKLMGHAAIIDSKIFESEKGTAHRNRAIAYLMKHFGVMTADIEQSLDLYFKQCSILATTNDLSLMASTLANRGVQPNSKEKVLNSELVTKTLSLMFTCGMYDTAGEWAFRVGLPAKSGVSGALFAVVPGQFGIAFYSPRIDLHGHSCRGRLAMQKIVQQLNLNIFNSGELS